MDPITLAIILGVSAMAATGLGVATPPLVRHRRLRRAEELVTRPIVGAQAGDGAARSVYEVFEDLGKSEYALEVMRSMDLLPESEKDIERVAANLAEAISNFGGYEPLVTSLGETIQMMHDEGGLGGTTGRLTLVAPKQTESLLPAVGRPTSQLPEAESAPALPPSSGDDEEEGDNGPELRRASNPPNPTLQPTVDQALANIFNSKSPQSELLEPGGGGLAAIVVGGVLGSLTTGGTFWDGVSRFVKRRRVKQMRTRLSQELGGLSLDVFHAQGAVKDQVDRNTEVFLQNYRWLVERHRREVARHKKLPKRQRSNTQQAMKLLATRDARRSLTAAERDVKQLKAQITKHRRSGRHDLAGFLLYVNREALLGGLNDFDARIESIEVAGYQLREAMLTEGLEQGPKPGPTQPQGPPPTT